MRVCGEEDGTLARLLQDVSQDYDRWCWLEGLE